jgi:hypothetical protein
MSALSTADPRGADHGQHWRNFATGKYLVDLIRFNVGAALGLHRAEPTDLFRAA